MADNRQMSKGDRRRARKAARAAGQPLTGELALDDRGHDSPGADAFDESPAGRSVLDRWVRRYDELNGAPEGDWDR